jgi:hypothetical protein
MLKVTLWTMFFGLAVFALGLFSGIAGQKKRQKEKEIVSSNLTGATKFLECQMEDGTYTKADLELAFLAGAKWWEWHKTGGTMWQTDQQLAFEEAQKKDWPEWLRRQKEHI